MSAQPLRPGRPTAPPASPSAAPPDAPAEALDARPYPEIPPGPLALRARHGANTVYDLGRFADEVTATFRRNRWLWIPLWLVTSLVVAGWWTAADPELLRGWLCGPTPEWAQDATSTFWGRFSAVAGFTLPVAGVWRAASGMAARRGGLAGGRDGHPTLDLPPTYEDSK